MILLMYTQPKCVSAAQLEVRFSLQEIQMMLWPQKSDCVSECPSVPPAHLLPTYYLPPETQGLR